MNDRASTANPGAVVSMRDSIVVYGSMTIADVIRSDYKESKMAIRLKKKSAARCPLFTSAERQIQNKIELDVRTAESTFPKPHEC